MTSQKFIRDASGKAGKGSLRNDPVRSQDQYGFGHKEAGLTLVELLVVLAILALFASIAVPQVLRYLGSARTETARTQVNNLVSSVELYYLDVGAYPPNDSGMGALFSQPTGIGNWNGPYLRKQGGIIDPWGREYIYRYPGEHGPFDVFSLGRDGEPGGDGEDQDIFSW